MRPGEQPAKAGSTGFGIWLAKPDTIRRRPKDKNGLFLAAKKMILIAILELKSAWGEMMRRLGEGMNPPSIWASRLALLLTVAGSVWFKIVLNNPTPLVFWAWAYLLVPVAFAAMPQLRQTRGALWVATGLLAFYCLQSASILTAVFLPGMLVMIFASIASFLPWPDETFRRKVVKRRALDNGCEEITLECGHTLITVGGVFEDSMYCAQCLDEFTSMRRTISSSSIRSASR